MSVLLDRNWEMPILNNGNRVKMLQQKGEIIVSDNAQTFKTNAEGTVIDTYYIINKLIFKVTLPSGAVEVYNSELKRIGENDKSYDDRRYKSTNYNLNLRQSGEYKLEFIFTLQKGQFSTANSYGKPFIETATAYIYVNPNNSSLKPYTLGNTIRRLLSVTPVRQENDEPRYKFNAEQLAEYDEEESPEFAFTGHTLFEALLIIAQYKGAFPVLKDNEISFRKLWNGTRREESELPAPIDEISCSDINQYCTYLETEVQNLVGVNDSQVGSIVEPYSCGYKTTRAASGSEISQDTAVISTDYNQYLHIKEEIGYLGSDMPNNGDITPYIYESGDYYALPDKSGAYPNSKAYALQWTQMGKNVTELAHRIQSKNSISKAFTEPALANIIQVKTGIDYDTGIVKFLQDLFNPGDNDPSFADLMFRTTYIPVINSRIKQYKEYFGNFHYDGSIKYNQTAELVDSELYGEHLKQLIRKIGNATKRKIYIFDSIEDVPKVGTLVDGYSVYDVQMSIRENKVIATISYVKYAELSQYIGVKNPWKDSDVSIDKCYNRHISYNEFLLFTRRNSLNHTAKAITAAALAGALPNTLSKRALTCVEATGYMAEGEKLNTVLLPVISLALGNSIMFQWSYQNNYSAGYMSEQAPSGATSLLSNTKYNRAQKAVKYSDMYGKLDKYDFALMPTGPVPDGKNMVWVEGDTDDIEIKSKVTNYPNTIDLTVTRTNKIGMHISEAYPVDITVKFSVTTATGTTNCTEIIPAGKVSITSTQSFKNVVSYEVISATCYDISDWTCYISAADVSRRIGYSLPLKPTELRESSDLTEWQGSKYINAEKLVVEKNSSEALSFSVQLHYCADDENFIVGSGLANFCSLIGGAAEEVGLYGFEERINIFDRRFPVKQENKLEDVDFELDAEKLRMNITLPSTINNYQAWALMGKDKKGNHQIIFGENRDLNGSDFETELYLIPMHKLEDFV